MKNISLVLNAVLFVAVGVLFYLQLSPKNAVVQDNTGTNPVNPGGDLTGIVYINIDTLLNNYAYYMDLQGDFAKKQSELEAELNNRSRQYEASAMDYQNKIQKGLVTRSEAAELEQQLLQEQQNLLQLRDDLSMQLQEEEQVSNRKLIEAIMVYLREYNKDYNYQFILSNSFGDNLLYVNKDLDITYSVLTGINAQYKADRAKQ